MTEQLPPGLVLEDYERFLAEYGFTEAFVRRLVDDMSDHTEMPPGPYKFTLASSPIQGCGLFAVAAIGTGEVFAPARIGTGRTVAGRRTNHSPLPNCRFEPTPGGLVMVSRRAIEPGEELTVDYRQVGSINGWMPAPSRSESLATLRWRALKLQHLGNPWARWAGLTDAHLLLVLDGAFARHRHLPSVDGEWPQTGEQRSFPTGES